MKLLGKKLRVGGDLSELIFHSKYYVSAQLVSKGLAFLSIPIFTRLMTPADYGIVAVFTSMVSILTIISGLGIKGAVSRYYYETGRDFFSYFRTSFWLVLLMGLAISLGSIVFRDLLRQFFNIPMGIIYIGLGVVVMNGVFEIYSSYLQASKQSRKLSILTALHSFIFTFFAIVFLLQIAREKYYAIAIAYIISSSVLLILGLIMLRKNLRVELRIQHVKYALAFGIPIVFHQLSQVALSTFDQVIINQILGQRETGLYSLAYKVGMIQSVLTMGILMAWTPMFYEKMKDRHFDDISSLAKKYCLIVSGIAIILIVFSKELIVIMADDSYYEAFLIIPIIVIGYYFHFLYTIYVNYAFFYKKTVPVAIATIIAGSINIGLNYWLIPIYGYIAAAWTTVISYGCLFFINYLNARLILKAEQFTVVNPLIFTIPFVVVIVVAICNHYVTLDSLPYINQLLLKILIVSIILVSGILTHMHKFDRFFIQK